MRQGDFAALFLSSKEELLLSSKDEVITTLSLIIFFGVESED